MHAIETPLPDNLPDGLIVKEENQKVQKRSFWNVKVFGLTLAGRTVPTVDEMDISNVETKETQLRSEKERPKNRKRQRNLYRITAEIPAFNEPLTPDIDKGSAKAFIRSTKFDAEMPNESVTFPRKANFLRRNQPTEQGLQFFADSGNNISTKEHVRDVKDQGSALETPTRPDENTNTQVEGMMELCEEHKSSLHSGPLVRQQERVSNLSEGSTMVDSLQDVNVNEETDGEVSPNGGHSQLICTTTPQEDKTGEEGSQGSKPWIDEESKRVGDQMLDDKGRVVDESVDGEMIPIPGQSQQVYSTTPREGEINDETEQGSQGSEA
jgi:hypothetical protein